MMETVRESFIRRVVEASVRAGKVTKTRATQLAAELYHMRFKSKRLAEAACNRELTDQETVFDTRLDTRVKEIGEELGVPAYRQGDPRGWTIRVVVGQELADCWDSETTGCG